ncbi:bcl-2-interacting killer isoform X1 [Tursiops truncatus]|uniref:Bcl-2-interacting killer isoform X1 n=2 Tax=Tursiops truncatus TaxID=9739 RepID=A0A6J3S4L0_TURTR|nr:bcl-2-interacting killer isoform X1 [Tursiops truncatus]
MNAGPLWPGEQETWVEEMYQARPLSRNLFLYTFLQNHGPGFLDDQGEGLPGMTNILEFHPVSPYSDGPHYLAMQLASIADEMELRLLLPQFVEPIRMTVYSHIGLRDILRSFMVAFTNLRENRSLWSFLTLRDRVSLDSMTLTYIPASGAAAPRGIPSLDATVRTTPYYPVLPACPVSTAAWSQRPLGLRLRLVDQMHESLPASTPEPCFSLCQESPPCG